MKEMIEKKGGISKLNSGGGLRHLGGVYDLNVLYYREDVLNEYHRMQSECDQTSFARAREWPFARAEVKGARER